VLRQLARLTRPIPAAGSDALAVAVYANARQQLVAARESGFEGVACVDDGARLLELLCDVWARTRVPWAERWARGLLDFVLWMQEPDGRWLNFVDDWDGAKNRAGITSTTGENFWHARALVAVSHAWLTFGDARAEEAVRRGLDHAVAKDAPPDVRALHVLVARRLIADAGMTEYLPSVRAWAQELAACREGPILKNSVQEVGPPHLWGHIQEGVLAWSAELLEDPQLLAAAVAGAEALLIPAVEGSFAFDGSTPYDVASTVYSLDRLAEATGEARWSAIAADARAWFDGRNAAGVRVYDPGAGRVADGIDEGRVSANSGAEANIEGASALFDRVLDLATRLEDPFVTAAP
jgi:hypothetical protein